MEWCGVKWSKVDGGVLGGCGVVERNGREMLVCGVIVGMGVEVWRGGGGKGQSISGRSEALVAGKSVAMVYGT